MDSITLQETNLYIVGADPETTYINQQDCPDDWPRMPIDFVAMLNAKWSFKGVFFFPDCIPSATFIVQGNGQLLMTDCTFAGGSESRMQASESGTLDLFNVEFRGGYYDTNEFFSVWGTAKVYITDCVFAGDQGILNGTTSRSI